MKEHDLTGRVLLRHRIRSLRLAPMISHIPSVSSVLPLSILLIGMSTVFFFVEGRGYFYRSTGNPYSHYSWATSHHMAIIMNLSLDHHFLGFENQSMDVEGNIITDPYNRFPPGSLLLIRLVTLPFKDGLSSQIYAARILMLVFFVSTAVVVYWSLCRLTSSRWISSAVILLVSSSTSFLHYNDMVAPDLIPDLFGFVLTFHGMIVFTQDGRFRQLVIKACFALLLGWHVLALLMGFVLLSLAKKIIQVWKVKIVRNFLVSVLMGQHFVLGIIALGLAILILAYNIGNEYYALNIREVRQFLLPDLPSVNSLFYRTGFIQESGDKALDLNYLMENFRRITLMSVPSIWLDMPSELSGSNLLPPIVEILDLFMGLLIVGACLIGVLLVRHRLLAMTAVVSGFCWSIPMYSNAIQHEFDALFYIGIPLFFYTLVLLLIREWLSERLMPLSSLVALSIFVFSSYQIGYVGRNDGVASFHESMIKDFGIIRELSEGGSVLVPVRDTEEETVELVQARYGLHYYLSERVILFHNDGCDRSLSKADFMIQTRRDAVPGLLTPDNQMMFLYDRYTYEERVDKLVEEVVPEVRGEFDVYLTPDRQLVYVSDRCDGTDTTSPYLDVPISLVVYPANFEDISDSVQQNFESYSLNFYEHFVSDTRRHVMIFDLPHYGIASISTGQYTDGGLTWGGKFFGPDHKIDANLSRQVDQMVASSEPNIRGRFDVYFSVNRTLIYIRELCLNGDIDDDFFVHVFPVDTKDLPEHRRQYEFDNLDFDFFERGFTDGQRCSAVIELPDYSIARISTGQYTDEGPIWRGEFDVTDG